MGGGVDVDWSLGLRAAELALAGGVVWAGLPELWWHYLGQGVIRRGPAEGGALALTFDDGPDPRYTPQILDLLAAHGARATFFVVGRKVRAHPKLVQRMVAEGHEVGNHTFSHRHAWWTPPQRVRSEIEEGERAIEEVAGQKPRYFRPPWGGFNLLSGLVALRRYQVVLWSCEVRDWAAGTTSRRLAEEVLSRAEAGEIVDLHDSGGAPGAAARTVEALRLILPGLAARGLRSVTLSELLPGGKCR
ncbi:MAG: polysaccharide deacetylase family protein [Bacillota bacterium]|nr:polysaccharide deacetylase family protein [Bacillota bacterium]